MPWPVPKLLAIEHPKPLSWRAWLPTLLLIASSAVGAVLLLWPHDKPSNTLVFWLVLAGVPLVACGLVFGFALDRWESRAIQAEEGEREQERLLALWKSWCGRHLRVAAAIAITPVPTARFVDANGELPVNKDRAKGLVSSVQHSDTDKNEKDRYGKAATALGAGIKAALENRSEISVTLLHDETSAQQGGLENELKRALEEVAPATRFSLNREPVTACATWIARQVDEPRSIARLIIAAQMWPDDDDTPHTYSEGIAAILIERNGAQKNVRYASSTTGNRDDACMSRILRPMMSAADKLDADIAQMIDMQTTRQPTHLWLTGCDAASSSAIRSAIKDDPKRPLIERAFDHHIGLRGPATSWIMLATVLEAAQPDSGEHLLALCEGSNQPLHLCMITPAAKKQLSEGKRSEI